MSWGWGEAGFSSFRSNTFDCGLYVVPDYNTFAVAFLGMFFFSGDSDWALGFLFGLGLFSFWDFLHGALIGEKRRGCFGAVCLRNFLFRRKIVVFVRG